MSNYQTIILLRRKKNSRRSDLSTEVRPPESKHMKNSIKKNKGFGTAAIFIVVAALLLGGGYYYAKKNEVKLIAPVEVTDWKTFSYKGYQFSYPPTWVSSTVEAQGTIFTEQGQQVAKLTCPIREVGYEAWDVDQKVREIDVAGKKHKVVLWDLVSSDGNPIYNFNLILINWNLEDGSEFAKSCELSIGSYKPEIAQKIYDSIMIQSDTALAPEKIATPTDNGPLPFVVKKPSWGISFPLLNGWNVTNDVDSQVILTQVSTGDRIILDYTVSNSYTDISAKFGQITYTFNDVSKKWIVIENTYTDGGQNSREAKPVSMIQNIIPIFIGVSRWKTYIIALSNNQFLKVNITGSGQTVPLDEFIKTIIISG